MEQKKEENTVVSIIVITYNSSKYVLETLESAKAQTYKNIELIIADDCSTDDTFDVCEKWINNNSDFFIRSKIVSASVNKGVAANCNLGFSLAKGNWIKLIAGDDILIKNCIETNINYLQKNRDANLIFSQSEVFNSDTKEIISIRPDLEFKMPENQFYSLLKKDFVHAPTVFCKKSIYTKVGGFDERYPFMEDYPMWYKLLKNGNTFNYIPIPTVKYRITGNSLSNSSTGINLRWFESSYNFYFQNIYFELKKERMFLVLFFKSSIFNLRKRQLKSNSGFSNFFFKIIIMFMNTFFNLFFNKKGK